MKNSIRILMTLFILGLSLPAAAQINAWLDHSRIGPGETVRLTLQYEGQTDSQPDLGPLKQDFEIVGHSSGSNIQIINGKMNAQKQISLMLLPKHSGKLHIPALQWNGQSSPILPLEVAGNSASAQPGNTPDDNTPAENLSHVFITTTPEQKKPYVQAAVPLTVRIYTDQPLYQASLDLQPGNNVLVQQLGKDRKTTETRNGRIYQVIERNYLLFPQRSGRIRLDGPVLNAQVQDSNNDPFGNNQFFGNIFGHNPFSGMLNATRPIRIQSKPVVLNVRPRPANASGHEWLPARKVTLEETWQPDNGQIHAGDPVTRHLQIKAEGLTAAQLPDLGKLMQLPDGLRAYPDQPQLNDDVQSNSVVGTRTQDIAIIANAAGQYEIPALHLYWWDTDKNVQREIELPARTLDVLPGTGGTAAPPAPSNQNSDVTMPSAISSALQGTESSTTNYRWAWISLFFALLWLGTLAAWWRSNRRNAKNPPNAQPATPTVSAPRIAEARKAFQQACHNNDAPAARRHLLDWARATWPQDPPIGLKALAERMSDDRFKPLLGELDRACYADGEWQGTALLDLKSLDNGDRTPARTETELAGLYP